MKKLLIAAALLPCLAVAQSQTPPPLPVQFRYSVVYDGGAFSPVIGTQVASLRNFVGTRRDAEVWFPVLGLSLSSNQPNFGAALVMPVQVADNARLLIGLAGKIEAGQKARITPIVGIEIRG